MPLVKVSLFITCLGDAYYPRAGIAAVKVLERLGCGVDFPTAQTCCGQMHVNTGYQPEALPLVRHFVETFEPYEAIVAPSGSCVGSVRHQHAMVARGQGDEALAQRAAAVADRTYELSELLEHGEWMNVAPGEIVIQQDEVGDAFYAIKSGQVDVFENDEFKRTMGPGSHFGEIALLLDVPRTATVVARTPVRAFRLDREGFDKLVVQAFRGGTLNPIISPDRIQKH